MRHIIKVNLTGMRGILAFVEISGKSPCSIQIITGNSFVNAKSVMDVFCVDFSHPLTVVVEGDAEKIDDLISQYSLLGIVRAPSNKELVNRPPNHRPKL